MKILHVLGYYQPEFGYKEYFLAREQVKAGHEVYIVASDVIYPFKEIEKLLAQVKSPHKNSLIDYRKHQRR